MKLLGIYRAAVFSPNMKDKDTAIMKAVSDKLKSFGYNVDCIEETYFSQICRHGRRLECDAIFTMMRTYEALDVLFEYQQNGIPAINPCEGINNAKRKNITRIIIENDIPAPYTIFDLDENQLDTIQYPCWIKRGEVWAQKKDDVAFAGDKTMAVKCVRNLKMKYGNENVMAVEHCKGDLVKFYGVEGTDFFYTYYPNPEQSKFGLELINGKPIGTTFDKIQLKTTCDRIAGLSKIYVYGGDCIIDENGTFKIIDFNDWPSFSACKEQAAIAIAERIRNELGR